MADSKWPYIVFLVSVIAASATVVYSTYSITKYRFNWKSENNYAQETQALLKRLYG